MKYSLASVALLAASVVAQSLPSCADTCAIAALGSSGCSPTDYSCLCTNQAYVNSFGNCIVESCSPADQQAAAQYGNSVCTSAGVTPVSPSITATGAAASASGSASSSASSVISSLSSMNISVATNGTAGPTNSMNMTVTHATITSTQSRASSPASMTTGSSASAASSSSSTGAAPTMGVVPAAGFGIAALIAGAAALL